MPRIRRFTALMANLLFAHLLWTGSGFACAMSPEAQDQQGAKVVGMDMVGMDMSGTRPYHSDEDAGHHHEPCESPTAPDDCESMTPCAPLALASATESPSVPDSVPSFVAPLIVLAPPSLASPPDPPPPRA